MRRGLGLLLLLLLLAVTGFAVSSEGEDMVFSI
jgi:hypothetical protein